MFDFMMTQILGMQWLSEGIWSLLEKLFEVNRNSSVWNAVHFFAYDTIKILLLLMVVIFLISYIQSYFPPEKTKRILTQYNSVTGIVAAALLGTVTPFCSCSSIPIFIGFTRAGMPLGITFSFLISSPMVDVASMLMLMSFFGAKFAITYVVLGLFLAMGGALVINSLHMERYLKDYEKPIRKFYSESEHFNQEQRIKYASEETCSIAKDVIPYILIGVAVGSVLHNWIPQTWILNALGKDNHFGVILATLVGVPVYADIFGTLPIADALYLAGVPAGTILALMMSVTTLSLPSLIMLSEVLHKKLLFTFVGVVVLGIVIIGYVFNLVW